MKGLLKRGTTWYIRYRFQGKDKWEAIGPSKRQAELVLAKRKVEIKEGQYFSTPKGLTWSYNQLMDRYLEYARVTKKPNTYQRTDCVYSKPLREAFGALTLKEITPAALSTYMESKLSDGLKPATVRHHLALMKHSHPGGSLGIISKQPVARRAPARQGAERPSPLPHPRRDRTATRCVPRASPACRHRGTPYRHAQE